MSINKTINTGRDEFNPETIVLFSVDHLARSNHLCITITISQLQLLCLSVSRDRCSFQNWFVLEAQRGQHFITSDETHVAERFYTALMVSLCFLVLKTAPSRERKSGTSVHPAPGKSLVKR